MYIPEVTTELRKDFVHVPEVIEQATGIKMFGKEIKSIIFTTDIAIIHNNNADAIIAVYPFAPHPAITRAITEVATVPVLCGVGGTTTHGMRSANVALHAEFQGVSAVVLNSPAPIETIAQVIASVDIPVVVTVSENSTDVENKLAIGASIVNVSAGSKTPVIVKQLREQFPTLPIIAAGGPTDESIAQTIAAGANAITYTPPSNAELFQKSMEKYNK